MKYLVMESGLSYVIVLDQQGRFIKAANMGYEVGQELDQIVELPEHQETIPLWRRFSSVTAAAACVCMLLVGSWYFALSSCGAVRMRINPDVMIYVNRMDRVVGLEGINEDGQQLIQDYRYFEKKLDRVCVELSERAGEYGYLAEGGEIAIRAEEGRDTWREKTERQLQETLEKRYEEEIVITTGGRGDDWEDEKAGQPAARMKDHLGEPASEAVNSGASAAGGPAEPDQDGAAWKSDDDDDNDDDEEDQAADDDRVDDEKDRADDEEDQVDDDDDDEGRGNGMDDRDNDDDRDDDEDDQDDSDDGRDNDDRDDNEPDSDDDASTGDEPDWTADDDDRSDSDYEESVGEESVGVAPGRSAVITMGSGVGSDENSHGPGVEADAFDSGDVYDDDSEGGDSRNDDLRDDDPGNDDSDNDDSDSDDSDNDDSDNNDSDNSDSGDDSDDDED